MKQVLHTIQSIIVIGVLFFANAALTIHHVAHHSHGDHHHHDHAQAHDGSSEEDCPVCEFDFAAFALFGQVSNELPVAQWLRSNNDCIPTSAFQTAPETFCLRGPPGLM